MTNANYEVFPAAHCLCCPVCTLVTRALRKITRPGCGESQWCLAAGHICCPRVSATQTVRGLLCVCELWLTLAAMMTWACMIYLLPLSLECPRLGRKHWSHVVQTGLAVYKTTSSNAVTFNSFYHRYCIDFDYLGTHRRMLTSQLINFSQDLTLCA